MKLYLSLLIIILFATETYAAATVNLYSWRDQEVDLWRHISENNLIPGVSIDFRVIRYETHDTYVPHVTIELLHKEADLFQWGPGAAKLKKLIEDGFIVPNQADISDINKAALLASLGPDGEYYGVPFALQLQSLIINNKLVRKAGITSEPKNLNEFMATMDKMKEAGVTPIHLAGAAGWLINQVIMEVMVAGAVEESDAQALTEGRLCFTSGEYVRVFDLLLEWKKKGYFNSNWEAEGYSGMGSSMAIGNSAAIFDGGWRLGPQSIFWQLDPDYQVDLWPVPGKSGKVYALGDGSYQVNHKSPRAKAAYRVLQYTATKEFAELFARYVGELPAYGGQIDIADPILKKMSKLVAQNSYGVGLFSAYSLNRGAPSYNTLVVDAFKSVIRGDSSPEMAGKAIQSGLNSWNYVGSKRCKP